MTLSPTVSLTESVTSGGMDTSLRLASLTAFYFGVTVATTPPTDPAVIDSVSQRAYRDLSRTLHGIGSHPEKTTLLESTHQSLYEFTANLDGVDSQDEFDSRHDAWCRKRIDFFAKHPREDRAFTFTYGHAQKWLNMAMKYLAVLDHPGVRHVYPYLHVPIDTIVYDQADRLGVPRPPRRRSWSRLNQEQYLAYQTQLCTRIAQQTTHSAPMDWESTAWIARNTAAAS